LIILKRMNSNQIMDTDNISYASDSLFEERQINDNGIDEVNEAWKTIFKSKYNTIDIRDNEDTAGKDICNIFKENLKTYMILAIGLTQSGKTRTMLSTIFHCIMNNIVPVENIYIITSLSSIDWKADTEKLLPDNLKERILHLPDFSSKRKNSIINEFACKNNMLILVDEVHIASKNEQVMGKIFEQTGILQKQNMLKRNIKMVEFSATPNGIFYGTICSKQNDEYNIYMIKPGEGYTSVFDLYYNGRVKEYKDLSEKKNSIKYIEEIKIDIQSCYPKNKKYHFIRTHTKSGIPDTIISNFQTVFGSDCEYLSFNEKDKYDINEKLKEEPKQHTFIFIKEKFRCAKVLNKTYVGICYERKAKKHLDYSVIIQGLIGRCSGYNDTGNTIIYTSIEAILAYEKLWNSKFQDAGLYWKYQRLDTHKHLEKIQKSTYNFINNSLNQSLTRTVTDTDELISKKFKRPEEGVEYFNSKLKRFLPGNHSGPRISNLKTEKKIIDGIEHTLYLSSRENLTKVRTLDEVKGIRTLGLKGIRTQGLDGYHHLYTYIAGYENISIPESVWFILTFYKPDRFVDDDPEITLW